MSPAPVGFVSILLLVFATVVCLLSCAGLVMMKGFYNKLHYLAPAAVLGTLAVAAAIITEEGWSSSALKVLLVLLVMIISNPVLTQAAARACFMRSRRVTEKRQVP